MAKTVTGVTGRQISKQITMKNMMYPSVEIEYTKNKLQEETRKRMIPLLSADGSKISLRERLILRIKLLIKKIFKLI